MPGAGKESPPSTYAARLQRCAHARQQLDVVQHQGPVFRYDERGQRVYLPDALRDAEIGRLRSDVARECPGLDSDAATRERKVQMLYAALCRRARDKLEFLEQPATRSGRQDLEEARAAVRNYCQGSRFPPDAGTRGEWFNAL